MAKYVLSERAKEDLREIANYTQRRWSDDQAEHYVRMLFEEFSRLADKPLLGIFSWGYLLMNHKNI